LPEIVAFEKNGIDAEGMDYSRLTPLLIEAVKALMEENKELKTNNKNIVLRLEKLEGLVNSSAKVE